MLTPSGCQARRRRLLNALDGKPELVLIADPQHLYYFANYFQSPFVFRSNDAGAVLLLHADGRSVLVADSMVKMFLDKAHVDEIVAPVWYDGKHSAPHREAFLVKNVLEQFRRIRCRRIGLEFAQVPAGILEGLSGDHEIQKVDPVFRHLRRTKDGDEIEQLNRSMRAGEAGMAAGMRDIKPGMTELEIYLLIQNAALMAAGEQAVVYGDFVTGPRTENISGPPTDRRVQAGELVLLDFSTVIGHYRADFANTHICAGKPQAWQVELYQACLEAMAAGEKMLKAGTPARDVYRAVHDSFAGRNVDRYFPHHAGHGIGLGHPEAPFLTAESSDTLLAGDVVTLEPGLYVKGQGGMRFERNYLIKDAGYELLSKHELTLG